MANRAQETLRNTRSNTKPQPRQQRSDMLSVTGTASGALEVEVVKVEVVRVLVDELFPGGRVVSHQDRKNSAEKDRKNSAEKDRKNSAENDRDGTYQEQRGKQRRWGRK